MRDSSGGMPTDDGLGILLFGETAMRRELLPAIRDEARRRALDIFPCDDSGEAARVVADQRNLLLCVVAWPDERPTALVDFVDELRRRQANPLLEIIVDTRAPMSDMMAARLRTLRVTPYRRMPPDDGEHFRDVLATGLRHALEKRSLYACAVGRAAQSGVTQST